MSEDGEDEKIRMIAKVEASLQKELEKWKGRVCTVQIQLLGTTGDRIVVDGNNLAAFSARCTGIGTVMREGPTGILFAQIECVELVEKIE